MEREQILAQARRLQREAPTLPEGNLSYAGSENGVPYSINYISVTQPDGHHILLLELIVHSDGRNAQAILSAFTEVFGEPSISSIRGNRKELPKSEVHILTWPVN